MSEPKITAQTIVIQKNKGITHALLDLVKNKLPNSVMSDNEITPEEWDNTLDTLIEINKKRQKEGKNEIFTGGTDKSSECYHTSFIVQPNQKIEFTADEMKSLYTAMGVTFSEQKENVEKKKEVEKKGKTDEKKDSEIEEKVTTNNDGTTITTESKDGKDIRRTSRDSDGKIIDRTEITYKDDNSKTEKTYDANKKLTKEVHSQNGEILEEYEYQDGKCIKSKFADDLYNQIDGPSWNHRTNNLLKKLTTENIIRVMSSYEEKYNKPTNTEHKNHLFADLDAEWFLTNTEDYKNFEQVYEDCLDELGLTDDASWDDIVKADYEKSNSKNIK